MRMKPGMTRSSESRKDVAQICNLPYRRFAIGSALKNLGATECSRTAGYKPAIQQISNLRYVATVQFPDQN